jgi:hypothetical protein
LPVRPQPIDLDEGAGQLFLFPRRCRFAGEQPNGDVLDPHRLARPQREIADDSIALVEQPEHGDALSHGRYPGLFGRGARHVDRDGLIFRCGLIAGAAAAHGQHRGKRKKGR